MKKSALLFITFLLMVSSASAAGVLVKDTVWSGRITLEDDILIPEGVTLTVLPGTIVNIVPSERTKTDPEYLSSLTEITVRGRMKVEGDKVEKIVFNVKGKSLPDLWAGIIVDGGTVNINGCRIENAESGIHVIKGLLVIKDSVVRNNHYGLVLNKQADARVENTDIIENEFGIFEISGPKVSYRKAALKDNKKRDLYLYGSSLKRGIKNRSKSNIFRASGRNCAKGHGDLQKDFKLEDRGITKRYGDGVLLADTVWRGRVEISGLIRVPADVRLVIMPGTIVEFRKKDTNGDGIGENALLMQGVLIAKGTMDNPIIFRSAEDPRRPGDWDSVNIMGSDGVQNLLEYVQIENAYRGLHFHFSNVLVNGSVLKDNYRAMQFQESSVELRDNYIFNNKSGVKARDSGIVFNGNYVFDNINGVNFFRTNLSAGDNFILGNMNQGMNVREGTAIAVNNFIDCNRSGLMINNSFFGKFSGNIITNNFESGISVRDSDNVELSGNFIQNSGFNGVNLLSSGGTITGNHISGNGERGIGIQSFSGAIMENIIVDNGLYAIENESAMDILAPMNWWGLRRVDKVIYDKFDDRTRGMVIFSPARRDAAPYVWPSNKVNTDVTWHGAVVVREPLSVIGGPVLTIAPGTKVLFTEGSGIKVSESRLVAVGKEKKRILFTSLDGTGDYLWDEMLIEHAAGSIFSYCDFEYATWAIHSCFTDLKVINSTFSRNGGGMRFRSGPVEISGSLFSENRIGIRAFLANALIKENEIVNNETGIFVREKGGGLTIRLNNIYSNSNYNIKIGDFNVEDVDARDNWWGTDDPVQTIMDGRTEPGVGKVIFEPVLADKLPFGDEEEEVKDGEDSTNDE